MKILITGGNGFLGKFVQQELIKYNINYISPTSKELNLLDYQCCNNFFSKEKPNSILHMAALCGGILANKNNPAIFLRDNIQMGLNVYEAARLNNITQIYSLGSVCMYPTYCPVPFKENDIWNGYPESTNAPYGHAKRTLLMLDQTYRQQYGFTGAHLIPVNLYGTKDKFDLINSHVIPALIRKFYDAITNKYSIVECWGSGEATREFLYVDDAAEAIVKAITINLNSELPINLGTGKDISIKKLSCLIGKLSGYEGKIVFNGEVSDGQPKRMLDVSRAKEILNWTANTSLEDGLVKTINWFKSQ